MLSYLFTLVVKLDQLRGVFFSTGVTVSQEKIKRFVWLPKPAGCIDCRRNFKRDSVTVSESILISRVDNKFFNTPLSGH